MGRAQDTLRARWIIAVLDGERLRGEELGEVRLAGVTVPPERQAAGRAYLARTIEGRAVHIAATTEPDPERRALVLITPKAVLIREGLATPCKPPGLWHAWRRRPLSDSP